MRLFLSSDVCQIQLIPIIKIKSHVYLFKLIINNCQISRLFLPFVKSKIKKIFFQSQFLRILILSFIINYFVGPQLIDLQQMNRSNSICQTQITKTIICTKVDHVYLFTSDEPRLEFSSSSRAQLWRFGAEPSRGTSIFELNWSWQYVHH